MKIIKPSFEFIENIDGFKILKNLELAGRVCYKSEEAITQYDSCYRFIAGIIKRGHETILEHEKVTVRIICDRGISHELVRHRIMSPSQESTRFIRYDEVVFIKPCFLPDCPEGIVTADFLKFDNIDNYYGDKHISENTKDWLEVMFLCERNYKYMIESGMKPQEARSVLPNSLKTELVITANLREWRHIFKLRAIGTTGTPNEQMLEIMVPMLQEFQKNIPVVFDDLIIKNNN